MTLKAALHAFGIIVLPSGLFWGGIGLLMGRASIAGVGGVAAVFAIWLLLESRKAGARPDTQVAVRIAIATEITAVAAVSVEPSIGTAIAIGSLIPVVVTLPYLERRRLTVLMVVSAIVGAYSLAAPRLLPWGVQPSEPLGGFLPSSTVVIVYAPVARQHPADRYRERAAPRHRDVPRSRLDP
jgi:hypothetical protein